MTKYFCDKCTKEIKEGDKWNYVMVDSYGRGGYTKTMYYRICRTCMDKLESYDTRVTEEVVPSPDNNTVHIVPLELRT